MNAVDKAYQTQLNNIQAKTGRSLEELSALVQASGLKKHGEIRSMLKSQLGLGHGDANTLTHYVLNSVTLGAVANRSSVPVSPDAALDAIYSGAKAALRPIHARLMEDIVQFGEFEIAPKKTHLSLRRKKQFAMIGPPTNSRVEVGLNVKDLPASPRLEVQPPGGMCNYKVRLTDPSQVDGELIGWIRQAYDSAG